MFRTERQRPARFTLIQRLLAPAAATLALIAPAARPAAAQSLGLLDGHADVGAILHPGNTVFDPASGAYSVTGSGDNLWFTADDMQFAWKRVHGDIALTAEIDFVGEKGNNHRKAALMVRQSLDPGSPYADVARHGDGLTSLQFRLTPGDVTREIEAAVSAPHWVRIERRGDQISVLVGDSPDTLRFSGATMHLRLVGDFYVGLAVCSHDKDVSETAIFRHLEIMPLPAATGPGRLWSTLETVKVASSDRRVAYTAPGSLSAPNWSHDGTAITLEQAGTLQRFLLDPAPYPSLSAQAAFSRQPTLVDTGVKNPLTEDHGASPNGARLAFSAGTPRNERLYVLRTDGGVAHEIPTTVSAEWHSWSPDGGTLAFTGHRAAATDIYTVPVQGPGERQLTKAPGPNRDPDFSPDGQWIYFSSGRRGHMQLWRMHPDGSVPEPMLAEASDNVAPHPSPDGKWVVYLALSAGAAVNGGEQLGELRLLSVADRKSHHLATVLAGPGTIPVPSWSPDSTRVAFISYAHLP